MLASIKEKGKKVSLEGKDIKKFKKLHIYPIHQFSEIKVTYVLQIKF